MIINDKALEDITDGGICFNDYIPYLARTIIDPHHTLGRPEVG